MTTLKEFRSPLRSCPPGLDSREPVMPQCVSNAYTRYVLPLLEPSRYKQLTRRLERYRHLEELSLEENRKLQWVALQRLLKHAYASSPFYRRRFEEAGAQPADIKTPADLAKFPPLTRAHIRENLSELWSRRYRLEFLRRSATGGTTDPPVTLMADQESVWEKTATQLRFQAWAGFHPGDKVFYLWGARTDFSQNPSWRWRLFDRYLMRRVWAPTSLFNQEVLASYRETLNTFRPRVIYASTTPLIIFCEFLRKCRRPYHRPDRLICTAEPLLADQRALIEDVLSCPVFEHYGAREFGMVAAECEQHLGLHVNPAAAYIEYVSVEEAEKEGLQELLITDLLNYGMPLIRYRINDCALRGPEACPCGRGYPLIQQIIGRTTDVFYLPDGTLVPGISLHRVITEGSGAFLKIQIIQDTLSEFRLRFVPSNTFTETDLGTLRRKLDAHFGHSIRWRFERVPEIEREASGKTRLCISRVSKPFERQFFAVAGDR